MISRHIPVGLMNWISETSILCDSKALTIPKSIKIWWSNHSGYTSAKKNTNIATNSYALETTYFLILKQEEPYFKYHKSTFQAV